LRFQRTFSPSTQFELTLDPEIMSDRLRCDERRRLPPEGERRRGKRIWRSRMLRLGVALGGVTAARAVSLQ
jgi:hypothetical protein